MQPEWHVIAHRGASRHAPENTLEAFELAVKQKADYIELDVWQTSDGELVVVHDEKLPNKSKKRISEVTRDELVNAYHATRNVTVPTLEKVLQALQNKIKFDIEIKFHGAENDILSLISTYLEKDDYIITSFSPKVLKSVSKIDKQVRTGYLMSPLRLTDWPEIFRPHKATYLQCTTILPYRLMVTRRLVKKYQEKGISTWTWVINDEKLMKKLIRAGVSGIITDDPKLAKSIQETLVNDN